MGIVTLVSGRLPGRSSEPSTPAMVIATTGGTRVKLPLAPLPTTHGGFGPNYETLGRGGRTGFLVPVDVQAKVWSATFVVGYPSDRLRSVDPLLKTLEQIRASKAHITMSYGRPERGVWRILDMTYDVTDRQPGSNEATRATVQLSLQQAVDVPSVIGPKRAPATATKANPPAPVKKPKHSTHVVQHGENLQRISLLEYGDALHWRQIGDANHITNPTLKVGMRLKLP